MAVLIGVDEAGYGPNLGPLVVAASGWCVPDDALCESYDLYQRLDSAVTTLKCKQRLAIADSKQLYKPGGGLAPLEQTVLACWPADTLPGSYQGLLDALQADPQQARQALPWHAEFDPPLPHDPQSEPLAPRADLLHQACQAADIAGPTLRARLVFPSEFNQLIDHFGTKGAALSHVTLKLVQDLVNQLAPTPVPTQITLDKHGGRNRYGALLQHFWPAEPLQVLAESRAESRYRCGDLLDFTFRSQGERFLPTALGSMTAKYLRELSMLAFNRFWQSHLPHLKPTAGYPADAKRFKAQIAEKQQQLALPDALLWRNR